MIRQNFSRLTKTGMFDLGTLPGGNHSMAYGINDSGQVVGCSGISPDGPSHTFLYTPGSGMQDLGTLTGDINCWDYALAINNSGQVAGWSEITPGGPRHAFLYTPGSGMTDIGTLTGDTNCDSIAFDINDMGQLVGYSETTPGGPWHAFLYTPGRGMKDLNTLLKGEASVAWGINNEGKVVGTSRKPGDSVSWAFLYTPPKGMQVLGKLSGYSGGSVANAINDMDQVVGDADRRGLTHAFLFDKGKFIDLGTFPGKTVNAESSATAINEDGIVVGVASIPTGDWHAFLYQKGSMVDLGTLGGNLSSAQDINLKGEVVGYSRTAGSGCNYHAFLYRPLPSVKPWEDPFLWKFQVFPPPSSLKRE